MEANHLALRLCECDRSGAAAPHPAPGHSQLSNPKEQAPLTFRASQPYTQGSTLRPGSAISSRWEDPAPSHALLATTQLSHGPPMSRKRQRSPVTPQGAQTVHASPFAALLAGRPSKTEELGASPPSPEGCQQHRAAASLLGSNTSSTCTILRRVGWVGNASSNVTNPANYTISGRWEVLTFRHALQATTQLSHAPPESPIIASPNSQTVHASPFAALAVDLAADWWVDDGWMDDLLGADSNLFVNLCGDSPVYYP